MEGVEDIPGAALKEGLGPSGAEWEWETFEEYLDALGRREFAADVRIPPLFDLFSLLTSYRWLFLSLC